MTFGRSKQAPSPDADGRQPPAAGTLGDLRRVIAAGEPRRWLILAGIAVSVIDVAATLSFPVLAQKVIDSMSSRSGLASAWLSDPAVLTMFALLVAGAIAGGISAYILAKAGLEVATRLKSRLFASLIHQPVCYFDRRESGELVSRLNNDTRSISTLVTRNLAGLVEAVLLFSGSAILLFLLDAKLTLVIFGVVAATFAAMAPALVKSSRITAEVNDISARLGARLTRVFSEIRLVKAFTAEPTEMASLDRELGAVQSTSLRLARIESALGPVNGMALTFALLIIFGYGGSRVAMGTLTIGTLTAFILYIFNIVAPLIQLSMFFSQYQSAKGSSLKLAEILNLDAADAPPAAVESAASRPLELSGTLSFEGVSFSYGSQSAQRLDLDGVRLECGKRTAIVGPSGSGKTTIFSLLARFYEPTTGAILLNGVDIATIETRRWRRMIGFVPQGSTLVNGTILDNIGYGEPDTVCRVRAEAAARSANCWEFISRLELGLDSPVGEAGNLVSGGQRQRIAIARVFYRNPDLLLLDEATSNLDELNETEVLDALKKLMAGRTTLLITHRHGLLDAMDHVVTIDEHGRASTTRVIPFTKAEVA